MKERSQEESQEQEAVNLLNVGEGVVRRLRDPVEKAQKKASSAMVLKQNLVPFLETGASGVSGAIVLPLKTKTRAVERI